MGKRKFTTKIRKTMKLFYYLHQCPEISYKKMIKKYNNNIGIFIIIKTTGK